MKRLIAIISFSTICFLINSPILQAQKNDNGDLHKAIASRQYVFKARNAMPAAGTSMQLTSEYDLTLRNDSLIANLPYFGRAYSTAIGRNSGGINFISTDFTYKISETKKGGWNIDIKPKDAEGIRQVFLSVTKNGYGTLHVTSQNRQAISYSGVTEPVPASTSK